MTLAILYGLVQIGYFIIACLVWFRYGRDGNSSFEEYNNFYGYVINGPLASVILSLFNELRGSNAELEEIGFVPVTSFPENAIVLFDETNCLSLFVGKTTDRAFHSPDEADPATFVLAKITGIHRNVEFKHEKERWIQTTSSKGEVDYPKEQHLEHTFQKDLFDLVIISTGKTYKLIPMGFAHYPSRQIINYLAKKKRKTSIQKYPASLLVSLVLLPPLITHGLPGLLCYCWFFLPLMAVLGLLYVRVTAWLDYCLGEFQMERESPGRRRLRRFKYLLLTILGQLCILLSLQMIFNYISLFYSGEAYLGVFGRDYALRTESECFVSNMFSGVTQTFTFFNW